MNAYRRTPDCPTVRRLCRTGNPTGHYDPPVPHCPICGCETDTFYIFSDAVVVGCSRCLKRADAYTEEAYE